MEPRERATSRFHANVGGVESTEAGGSGPRRGRLEDLAHRVGSAGQAPVIYVAGRGDDDKSGFASAPSARGGHRSSIAALMSVTAAAAVEIQTSDACSGASTRQQTRWSNRCDEREQPSPRANSILIELRKTVYENLGGPRRSNGRRRRLEPPPLRRAQVVRERRLRRLEQSDDRLARRIGRPDRARQREQDLEPARRED